MVNVASKNQFISVVDDEAGIAYLFRDVLSTIKGVRVFAFTEPVLALEHFQTNHRNYKCVITDFRMPSMNGVQFLDKVNVSERRSFANESVFPSLVEIKKSTRRNQIS